MVLERSLGGPHPWDSSVGRGSKTKTVTDVMNLFQIRLASYGNGTLTSVFLDRLFQECLTFGGEMDYKMYMDFVLAMENKDQPRSLAFFFRFVLLSPYWRVVCTVFSFSFHIFHSKQQDLC